MCNNLVLVFPVAVTGLNVWSCFWESLSLAVVFLWYPLECLSKFVWLLFSMIYKRFVFVAYWYLCLNFKIMLKSESKNTSLYMF